MRRRGRRGVVWLGVAVTACSVLAGCAGGGSGGSTDQDAALTGDPVKIGVLVARSGFNSELSGPVGDAAQGWANWVNDNGGLGGRPVEVIAEDTGGTPATGQALAKDFVEKQQVVAVMLADPSVESGVADYLQQNNVPVIESLGFDVNSWGVRPNFFTTATSDVYMQASYAISAADTGSPSIAVAACAEAPTCAQVSGTIETVSPTVGLTYDGAVRVAASQPSFTAECLSFLERRTQFIAMALSFAGTGTRMVTDCLQQGYGGHFGVSSGSVVRSLLDEVPGAKYSGALNGFPWWVDAAPVQTYRDAMAEYAPDVEASSAWITSAWAGLEMFRKAVSGTAAGGLTREQVFDGYHAVQGETLDGLLPQPMTYTAGQPAPAIECFWLYSFTQGDAELKIRQEGRNGNGATGPLASTCFEGALP